MNIILGGLAFHTGKQIEGLHFTEVSERGDKFNKVVMEE